MLGIEQLPDVVGGGVYWPRGDRAAVLIDKRLTRLERLEAVAHELVHDEHGGGCDCEGMPDTWTVVAERAEARVHNEVARRLVPLDQLAAMRAIAEVNQLTLDSWHVAEHFDVPERVAARAMRLLDVD